MNQKEINPILRYNTSMLNETQRAFISERIALLGNGGNHPHVRNLEAACYSLLAPLETDHSHNGFVPVIVEDKLIALRDDSIIESDFITAVVNQRLASFGRVERVAEAFEDLGIKGILKYGQLFLPVVMINADNIQQGSIGVTSQEFIDALKEAPYWKASEHMLFFSHEDDQHDYERYARNMASILNIDLNEFLLRQQTHEGLHPIIDHLTDTRFGYYSTWLNEGFCELFSGFENRARHMFSQAGDPNKITPLEVMASTDRNILHGGGYFLLKSIGRGIDPTNLEKGVGVFLKKLFIPETSPELKLNDLSREILAKMGITDRVETIFQKEVELL